MEWTSLEYVAIAFGSGATNGVEDRITAVTRDMMRSSEQTRSTGLTDQENTNEDDLKVSKTGGDT